MVLFHKLLFFIQSLILQDNSKRPSPQARRRVRPASPASAISNVAPAAPTSRVARQQRAVPAQTSVVTAGQTTAQLLPTATNGASPLSQSQPEKKPLNPGQTAAIIVSVGVVFIIAFVLFIWHAKRKKARPPQPMQHSNLSNSLRRNQKPLETEFYLPKEYKDKYRPRMRSSLYTESVDSRVASPAPAHTRSWGSIQEPMDTRGQFTDVYNRPVTMESSLVYDESRSIMSDNRRSRGSVQPSTFSLYDNYANRSSYGTEGRDTLTRGYWAAEDSDLEIRNMNTGSTASTNVHVTPMMQVLNNGEGRDTNRYSNSSLNIPNRSTSTRDLDDLVPGNGADLSKYITNHLSVRTPELQVRSRFIARRSNEITVIPGDSVGIIETFENGMVYGLNSKFLHLILILSNSL